MHTEQSSPRRKAESGGVVASLEEYLSGNLNSHKPSKSPFYFLLGSAFLVVITGGYFAGNKWQIRQSAPITAGAHFKEEALRREVRECNLAFASLQSQQSDVMVGANRIKAEVDQLQTRSNVLYSRHEQYEQEAHACAAKAELERHTFNEQDAAMAAEINTVRREVDFLQEKIEEITDGRGSRLQLEIQALKAMRRLHAHLREALQIGLAPLGSDTLPTIEAELLTKWGMHLDNETLFNEQSRRSEMINYVKNWERFEYDPATHHEIVTHFVRLIDGNVARLSWNGKPMKPVRGLTTDRSLKNAEYPLPAGTVADTLVGMYDATLCSYRRNETRILYPVDFQWLPSLVHSTLDAVLDSPLVTLCAGCGNPTNSSQFHMACGRDNALRMYGSYPFWAMRSMMRFTSDIYEDADSFMTEHGLVEGEFTAAVNYVTSAAAAHCRGHESLNYGPHRLWLEHNYGFEAVHHVSDERDEQCAPSTSDVRRSIAEAVRNARMGSGFGSFVRKFPGAHDDVAADDDEASKIPKVYLSTPEADAERIQHDDNEDGFKLISHVVRGPRDEAIDMVIASRAGSILVSPFFKHSQVITELFLLRNAMAPTNIKFF